MDLTKQERQVIIFVLGVSLAGVGLEFLARHVPPLERSRLIEHMGKIDLNKADKATLEIIPGIGEKLACRIIAYREDNDGFAEIEELSRVKGVNPRLMEKLRERVFIR